MGLTPLHGVLFGAKLQGRRARACAGPESRGVAGVKRLGSDGRLMGVVRSGAVRAGTVWVNCYNVFDAALPFGGYKQSGNGRDKSVHAFDKYTELKATWLVLE